MFIEIVILTIASYVTTLCLFHAIAGVDIATRQIINCLTQLALLIWGILSILLFRLLQLTIFLVVVEYVRFLIVHQNDLVNVTFDLWGLVKPSMVGFMEWYFQN